MKIIKFLMIIMVFTGVLSSCSNDSGNPAISNSKQQVVAKSDNTINAASLPQAILDYITTNYPNKTIDKSEIEDNGNYEVKLSNNVELIFDAQGAFIGIDDDGTNDYGDTHVSPNSLPQVILDYIAANYSSNTIHEAELENNGNYEVELNSGVVLVFDGVGSFLGEGVDQDNIDENGEHESDNSDNETSIDPATLPQTAKDYLLTNYPNETIVQAEVEDNGNYEVTLSNGVEVYFDSNGEFIKTGDGDDDGDGHRD